VKEVYKQHKPLFIKNKDVLNNKKIISLIIDMIGEDYLHECCIKSKILYPFYTPLQYGNSNFKLLLRTTLNKISRKYNIVNIIFNFLGLEYISKYESCMKILKNIRNNIRTFTHDCCINLSHYNHNQNKNNIYEFRKLVEKRVPKVRLKYKKCKFDNNNECYKELCVCSIINEKENEKDNNTSNYLHKLIESKQLNNNSLSDYYYTMNIVDLSNHSTSNYSDDLYKKERKKKKFKINNDLKDDKKIKENKNYKTKKVDNNNEKMKNNKKKFFWWGRNKPLENFNYD
jgi:hypothetical protein